MKGFFEPTSEEKKLGWAEPTRTHGAIAKLVKNGYIRVILTTNFDHLLERALEAEGIIPQVIYHESDIEKVIPIVQRKTLTIIKINGDYIDCRFRNTTEELDDYPEPLKNYVCGIFEDYGLITCR
jgi:NAD-dependent SIR2 family protein deacetylase